MTLEELNEHFDRLDTLHKTIEISKRLRDISPQSPVLSGMPHTPGVKDKVGDLAAEIADMDAVIRSLREEIAEHEPPVEGFIRGIKDNQTRIVFRLRFLRGLSWKEVSQILGKYTTEKSVSDLCYRYMKKTEDNGT